ncbi:hypothetical protein EVAR_55043_1 [Eumeta japonica]|uniref:Uncharacterized protein n=1 Tax=Eumeta variegata TaxID=151549 RepID=A0A4C1ZTH6_EUMVA|nr:hypothetical protein EVAR_55043_1 [Eumeta japonica]
MGRRITNDNNAPNNNVRPGCPKPAIYEEKRMRVKYARGLRDYAASRISTRAPRSRTTGSRSRPRSRAGTARVRCIIEEALRASPPPGANKGYAAGECSLSPL